MVGGDTNGEIGLGLITPRADGLSTKTSCVIPPPRRITPRSPLHGVSQTPTLAGSLASMAFILTTLPSISPLSLPFIRKPSVHTATGSVATAIDEQDALIIQNGSPDAAEVAAGIP